MKGLGYDGKYFADLGLSCNFPDFAFPGADKRPLSIDRLGQPPIQVGTQHGLRTLTFSFLSTTGADAELTRRTLLSALESGTSLPRVFVAEFNDGTEVESLMTVGQWRPGDVNETLVDFYQADPAWYERTDTILGQLAFTGPIAIPMLNTGGATVAPVVQIGYSVQRTTESATVGWKWRRTKAISNGGDRNWNRVRLTMDLGDTAAWVTAGKALSSGDDVRVRFEGREFYRTLTNWNTKRTQVHFIGTIPAGKSATYEIVYGNPDATTPRTLSTRGGNYDTYAADDLEGYSGTATSGTTGSMTDSGAAWATDRWRDGFVTFTSGTGSIRTRRILSNTGTVLTLNRVAATAPDATTTYVIWKAGIFQDGGRVTAKAATTITDNLHTTKWAPQSLKGATVTFIAGSGATPATMTVLSNTTDTITFTTAFSVEPAVNDQYHIERYGTLNYNVDLSLVSTAQRGLWRTSKYSSSGGRTRFGDQVPGGFLPSLMVDNQDQFAQLDVTDETAGASVSNWPYLSARRRVRSDLSMPQKGVADGVCLYDPRGLVSLAWDYRMENDNAIAAVVVMTQEPDGDGWDTIASDATARATFVAVTSGGAAGDWNLIGDEDPVRLYLGVIPADGVTSEIGSNQSKNRNAEVRNHTRMIVYLSLDDCGGLSGSIWTAGSEVAIYDLNVRARLGGGAIGAETPTYYTYTVGEDKDANRDGHYVHLASGQKLWFNPSPSAEDPLLGIYDSSDVLVSRTPYAAVINRHELNIDGTDTEIVDYEFPVPPGTNLIPTGEDSSTGWTITNSAGVTATIADGATVWDGGTTSLKVNVTTTPAGAWTITLTRTADSGRVDVIPGSLYDFGFVRRRNALTASITCEMTVTWSYNAGTPSAVDVAQTIGGAMAAADTWYPAGTGRAIHPGSVAEPATTEAAVSIVIGGTGSTSGTIFIDPVTLGVPNLYLDEDEIGTLTVDIFWNEAHLA